MSTEPRPAALTSPSELQKQSVRYYGDVPLKTVYPSDSVQQNKLVNRVLEACVFFKSYEWFQTSFKEGLSPQS